jgi:hypothetical protein
VDERDVENELVRVRLCVTGSVAVGAQRDGRDTTGRDSIIELYLAQRADFAREFANSANGPIGFSRARVTLVRKTSAFGFPEFCFIPSGGRVLPRRRLPPTASREWVRPLASVNPSRLYEELLSSPTDRLGRAS